MLKFLFANETKIVLSKSFFEKIVIRFESVLKSKIIKSLKFKNAELSLTLVNDKEIKSLNSKYRNKKIATDVLSFAYMDDKKMTVFQGSTVQVGDIFISIDTAKRQAKDHNHELKKELEILFIHGLLHLFGFDHNNDKEEKEMEKWAKKILQHIL